ncbi:unnamed protein product, partial [Laminaria digitata]
GASRVRERLSLRRSNSLSAAGHQRRSGSRSGSSSVEIEAMAARMHRQRLSSGGAAVPPVHHLDKGGGGRGGSAAVGRGLGEVRPGLGLDARDDVAAAAPIVPAMPVAPIMTVAPIVPVMPVAPAAQPSPMVRSSSRTRSRSRGPERETSMDYSSDAAEAGVTPRVSTSIEHIFAAVSATETVAPHPIVVMPSADVNLGPPLAKVSPLLVAASSAGGGDGGDGGGRRGGGIGGYPFFGGELEAAEAKST